MKRPGKKPEPASIMQVEKPTALWWTALYVMDCTAHFSQEEVVVNRLIVCRPTPLPLGRPAPPGDPTPIVLLQLPEISHGNVATGVA
jgi:hypothetical protein